jgi:hypothetical protein
MRFILNSTILITTLLIGGGRVEAQGNLPWDPGTNQGTHLQTEEFVSIFIDWANNSKWALTAVNGLLTVAGNPNFTGHLVATVTKKLGQSPELLDVNIKVKHPHENPYGGLLIAKYEYEIEYAGHPLCKGKKNRALAIQGTYSPSTNAIYLQDPTKVSFACIPEKEVASGHAVFIGGGVAAKCIDWGYPPWPLSKAAWDGPTLGGFTLDAKNENQSWPMHLACLAMAMADYCGNGQPHTVDGTWIDFGSAATLSKAPFTPPKPPKANEKLPGELTTKQLTPKHPRPFFFEAAWRGDPYGPICVTKTRWSTIPVDCPLIQSSLKSEKRWFCEEFTEAELENDTHQAVPTIFSYSPFLDVGLYNCHKGATAWVTTSTAQLTSSDIKPPLNYRFTIDPTFVCVSDKDFEGTVLRPDATSALLPNGFPDWNGPEKTRPIELYLHSQSGIYFTDTNKSGSPPPQHIGYILPAEVCAGGGPFCGAALTLYTKSGPPDEYWTSTKISPPPGFGQPKVLGYLISLRP